MKLTDEHIAKLESFLDELGSEATKVAAKTIGVHPASINGFLVVMRRVGIPVVKSWRSGGAFVAKEELEAFRSWKSSLPRAAE